MASKDKAVDAKALMAAIAKGWKLVNTPKVRAGFKAGQQKLVQSKDGKTLGMLTLREQGVRVEGSRLAKNVTVPKDATVEQARKLLADVEQENARKDKEREAKKTKQPTDTPKGKFKSKSADTRERVAQMTAPSGKRARSRTHARPGVQVVAK